MCSPPAPHRDPARALRPRTFAVLDGMRGLAAVAVALRHAPFLWATPGGPTGLLRETYLAVDFFFILSGFVLEHAYRGRIEAGLAPLAFMRMRLARLYPLYGAALVLAIASLMLMGRFVGDWSFAVAAAFLPTPASDPTRPLFPLNYPSWSLFFELVINLVFVAAGRRLTSAMLGAVVVASGLALCWSVLGCHAGFAGDMDAGATWGGVCAGLLRVTFGFFAGVLCYRIWNAGRLRFAVSRLALLSCLAAVLVSGPPELGRPGFDLVAVIVAFPLLVVLAAGAREGGRSCGILRWLGSVSYGVYVLQAPIYFAVSALVARPGPASGPMVGVGAVLLVLALSHLATTFFDAPVRRLLAGLDLRAFSVILGAQGGAVAPRVIVP